MASEAPPPSQTNTDLGPSLAALRATVGPERAQWRTLDTERLVLVVTRTETTTSVLLDIISNALADTRLQIVFTVADDRSAFADGLEASLRAQGLLVIPWARVTALPVDLVLAASHAGKPIDLDAPTLIFPHGYGNAKRSSHPDSTTSAGSKYSRRTVHAAPHESGRCLLPPQDEVAIVGDPILDSLRGWLDRAPEVRRALGVAEGQRLVVTSSTWGPSSLFATRPGVFEELLAELPTDEYVLAAILHPNIWISHGRWQTRTWLQRAVAAGLRLVPFEEGWRPAITAADVVIGDHGSVSFYADLLGKAQARIYGSLDELTPGTVVAAQARRSPRIGTAGRLRDVLEALPTPSPESVSALTKSSVQHVGRSHERIRRVAYDLLGIAPPSRSVVRARAGVPQVETHLPTCHWVRLVTTDRTVRLERFTLPPSSTAAAGTTPELAHPPPAGAVLAAHSSTASRAQIETSSVLLHTAAGLAELRRTLDANQGSQCAAASESTSDPAPSIIVLRRGETAARRFRSAGIQAHDERALTAAALLVLGAPPDVPVNAASLARNKPPHTIRCGALAFTLHETSDDNA